MNSPLISICIPVYNCVAYIRESIESCLLQTYSNVEIIIVDNCSTDGTWELVSSYRNKVIKKYRNSTNIGMANNFNKAISLATGEYIKLLCADDYIFPECLEKLYKSFTQHEHLSLVACRRTIGGSNTKLINNVTGYINGNLAGEYLALFGNYIGEPSVIMLSRSGLKNASFSNEYKQLLDVDFYINVLKNGDLFILPDVLAYFRIHDLQQSEINRSNPLIKDEYKLMVKSHQEYQSARFLVNKNSLAFLFRNPFAILRYLYIRYRFKRLIV